MGLKVVPDNNTPRDCHPSFYEGNHRDYYLSLLPVFMSLPLFTVRNSYSWSDPILSPKAFNSLLGVYQTLESTHS